MINKDNILTTTTKYYLNMGIEMIKSFNRLIEDTKEQMQNYLEKAKKSIQVIGQIEFGKDFLLDRIRQFKVAKLDIANAIVNIKHGKIREKDFVTLMCEYQTALDAWNNELFWDFLHKGTFKYPLDSFPDFLP